jgi:sterol desaturase/sphingolipid hydroxylase (fatty acid hydroxylase superfamily)
VFGSPAFHQTHHSYAEGHVNKNFGVKFAFWDVLFNTYIMPASKDSLKIGLGKNQDDSNDYNTCIKLYTTPFKKLFNKD